MENQMDDLITGANLQQEELFKGTKGTWYLQDYSDAYTNIVRSNDGINETIYITNVHGASRNNQFRYDALLISKAPEMLEMLIDIIEQENVSQSAHDAIYELIKQATEL